MAIVTQTDKRSGITYTYETTYYRDKGETTVPFQPRFSD